MDLNNLAGRSSPLWKAAEMAHPNERVELAMQILECRRKLRRTAWDDEAAANLRAEIEALEQKLREIDE